MSSHPFAFNAPCGAVSFGQTTVAILREMHRRGLSPAMFPIGPIDLSTHKADPEFARWLDGCVQSAQSRHLRSHRAVRLWHISSSLESVSNHSNDLITFQETGQLTPMESHILSQQRRVYVTNRYAQSFFTMCGVNATYLPLGFDSFNFASLSARPSIPGVTSWLLVGKAEARKHTYRQLALWCKRYGNRKEHRLNCAIANPFLKPEDQNGLIGRALEGKQYWNVSFLPWCPTNAEYNQLLQSSEILLACSGSEGFGLPEYHATALGIWPVALKAHAYLDYLTDQNAILVPPNGMEPIYDGVFFHQGQPVNQGNRFTFSDEAFYTACEEAERRRAGGINTAGLALQSSTYQQTVDTLIHGLET